jgi:HTH-type transcriptional regulator/antitoxin HipB
MDYSVKFGDQLKQQLRSLRKARGLNQTELGVRLGVTQRRIAEIEANPGVVAIDQIIKIFSALGAELVVRDLSTIPLARSTTAGVSVVADTEPQHVFKNSLVPSARHLVAALQGNPKHVPEALLARDNELLGLNGLPPRDKARLIGALANALLVNPRLLEGHLNAMAPAASEGTGAPVSPIQDQWARALEVTPERLRQAVSAALDGRHAPIGLATPPSKGIW